MLANPTIAGLARHRACLHRSLRAATVDLDRSTKMAPGGCAEYIVDPHASRQLRASNGRPERLQREE